MSYFINFFHRFGLLAIFLFILLEYACFPVSSEIILPLSGALIAMEQIPLYHAIPLSVVAGMAGTSLCFFIGKTGGPPILEKLTHRFPKTKKPIQASFEKFQRYGIYAVGFGRVIPLCRTYIAFIAGAVKQPYSHFFFSSIIGITIWNTLLIGLGYLLKDNWNFISGFYNQYKQVFLLIFVFLFSYFILTVFKNRHQRERTSKNP